MNDTYFKNIAIMESHNQYCHFVDHAESHTSQLNLDASNSIIEVLG